MTQMFSIPEHVSQKSVIEHRNILTNSYLDLNVTRTRSFCGVVFDSDRPQAPARHRDAPSLSEFFFPFHHRD